MKRKIISLSSILPSKFGELGIFLNKKLLKIYVVIILTTIAVTYACIIVSMDINFTTNGLLAFLLILASIVAILNIENKKTVSILVFFIVVFSVMYKFYY